MLLGAASCAIAPTIEERETAYLALGADHFKETLEIIDDPLNPSIELNTKAAYMDQIFGFALKNDQFLRANIVRADGSVGLQGYVMNESTADWLRGSSVRFAHTLKDRLVTRVHFDAQCPGGHCRYREDFVFSLKAEELRAAIAEAKSRGEQTLIFRIQGQGGVDRDGRFHIGEAAALLDAIEVYTVAEMP